MLRELALVWAVALLVVPHSSSLEFQITQGASKSQWGQPTQSSLQREQDLIADTIQAEEYKQGYGWLRVVTWGCMIAQAFYWLFYMTLTYEHICIFTSLLRNSVIKTFSPWIIRLTNFISVSYFVIFYLIHMKISAVFTTWFCITTSFHTVSLHFQLEIFKIQETIHSCR